jgi:prepilin-type N-terminal cleavage/methylation domain-containing protein
MPRGLSAARGPAARGAFGFTLIEILVALAVLAASVLLITRAFLTILEVTADSGRVAVASALAVRRLEQIRSHAESQPASAGWTANFEAIVDEGPTLFPSPYDRYSYQVQVNGVDLTPSAAAPSWLIGPPVHANTMKWVTVRVAFQGDALAQVSSGIVRDMYHRP